MKENEVRRGLYSIVQKGVAVTNDLKVSLKEDFKDYMANLADKSWREIGQFIGEHYGTMLSFPDIMMMVDKTVFRAYVITERQADALNKLASLLESSKRDTNPTAKKLRAIFKEWIEEDTEKGGN